MLAWPTLLTLIESHSHRLVSSLLSIWKHTLHLPRHCRWSELQGITAIQGKQRGWQAQSTLDIVVERPLAYGALGNVTRFEAGKP